VDVASDRAPSGARGHRVILTRAAAEAALPSLMGMAVDYKTGWDGHDARQKCGIITTAELDGRKLRVAGFIFAKGSCRTGRFARGIAARSVRRRTACNRTWEHRWNHGTGSRFQSLPGPTYASGCR